MLICFFLLALLFRRLLGENWRRIPASEVNDVAVWVKTGETFGKGDFSNTKHSNSKPINNKNKTTLESQDHQKVTTIYRFTTF